MRVRRLVALSPLLPLALLAAGVRAEDRQRVFTQEDREIDEAFAKAAGLELQGRWSQAGEEYAKLETLVEKKREKDQDLRFVTRTGERLDKGVNVVLRERLKKLAPEGLATYRTLVDARAKANYEAALDAEDQDALEAIAERYSFSQVAPLALQSLGDRAFERGDLARAERAFAKLERDARTPEEAKLSAYKRLCAAAARGDAAAAADALASFAARGGDAKAATIPSGDKLISAEDAVAEAGRAAARSLMGPVDPARLVGALPLDTPELPEELASRLERVTGVVPPYQEPVRDAETGLVLVADGKTVRALDADGQGRGWKFSVAGAQDEPGRLEVATERPALGGGRVYATLFRNRPASRVKRPAPANPPTQGPGKKKDKAEDEEDIVRQADWRVVALDSKTGRFEWDAAGMNDVRFDDFARNAEWVSAPLFAEGQVFVSVLVRKGSDLRSYLVALDATTGRVRSRAFLASRSPYDFLGLGSPLPAPAFRSGRLYVATSLGVVACVEPTRAEVLWIAHYASVPERSQPDVVRGERRFRAHAPLVGGSPVVVAPVDAQEVIAFDPDTGERAWSLPRGSARVVSESPSGSVLLADDRVTAFDRRTGSARFVGERLGGRPIAAPLALGDEAVLPCETALVRVSLKDGKVLGRYRFEHPTVEAGAVAAAGDGRVLTASYARANVYEDRARTLEAAKGRSPGEVALLLGEVAAHRGDAEDASRKLTTAAQDATLGRDLRARARRLAFAVLAEQAARARDEKKRAAFLESARGALEHASQALGASAAVDPLTQELARRAATLRRQYADELATGTEPGELATAAEEYGKLIATPQGTLCALDSGIEVDARAYATLRVRELIAARGRACYSVQDRAAAEQVKIAVGTGTKEGLERVARLYPASQELAPALWELHRFFLKGGLESEAAVALDRLATDAPDSKQAPEALARLALLDERLHRPARARRVATRLAALPEDTKVQGGDGLPERSARALAAEVLARNTRADSDALARQEATADLEPPLRRVFRSTTELSANGAELVEPRNFAGAPRDRFLVRRGKVLESRSTDTGVTIATVSAPEALQPERRWPGYSGGSLVVPAADRIIAYDAATGAVRWEATLAASNPLRAQIGPDDVHLVDMGDAVVLVQTRWNDLVAIDGATGARLWTRALERRTDASVGIIAHGAVGYVLGDVPAKIEAVDLATGKSLWTWKGDAAPGVIARLTQARIVGSFGLGAILEGKRLALIDRQNGATLWYANAGEGGWLGEIKASPDGSSVLVRATASSDVKFWVFDARTGKELWRDDGYGAQLPGSRMDGALPFLEDVVPGEGAVYSFRRRSGASEVWAQDLVAGTKLWQWEAPRSLSGPTTIVETPTSLVIGRDGGLDRASLFVLGKGTGQPEQVAVAAPGDPLLLPGRKLIGRGLMAVGNTIVATTERGTCGLACVDDEALARETIDVALRIAKEDSPEARAALAHELAKAQPPRLEDATLACARALESENVSGEQYDRIFAQLAALAETAVEVRPPGYEIRRMPRPPEIDGELNDWWRGWSAIDLSGPRYVQPIQMDGGRAGRWNGPEDLSAKLYMGWDDKYFYFALDVMDADLRPYDSESDRWIGDCLLIAIDCKNDGGFRFMRDDMLLSLALTLPKKKKEDKEKKEGEDEDQNKPEGKYFVKRKDDGSGAIYEAQIPWAIFVKNGVTNGIDQRTGVVQPGFTFGFNVVLIDDDGDRYSKADLPPGAKGDGTDGNPKEGDFRGALKTLQLTPSVLLHERKDRLWQGYVPEYFAKITLK